MMMENAWIIPLFPLLSFLILLLFGKRLKDASAYVGILFTLAALVYSLLVLFERFSQPTFKTSTEWLRIGDISLTAGFEVNQLNALMLVIVSLVSFLVHTYSKGYMHGDERFPVFYAYL
jgi:NADH-quinone oxidoreductase subunit L